MCPLAGNSCSAAAAGGWRRAGGRGTPARRGVCPGSARSRARTAARCCALQTHGECAHASDMLCAVNEGRVRKSKQDASNLARCAPAVVGAPAALCRAPPSVGRRPPARTRARRSASKVCSRASRIRSAACRPVRRCAPTTCRR